MRDGRLNLDCVLQYTTHFDALPFIGLAPLIGIFLYQFHIKDLLFRKLK